MPEPLKSQENQRGHRTKAEKQARLAAEDGLRRERRPTLHKPGWLSAEAGKVFEATKRRMRGLGVLDTADADVLAIYADAVARYAQMMKAAVKQDENGDDQKVDLRAVQAAQAWSRIALSYAEKLGLTASARARLARRRAVQEEPDELEQLVEQFMGAASAGAGDGVR